MSQNFWDKNAQNWTTAVRDQRIASRVVTNKAIVDAISASKIKSLLDIGCGEGWLGHQLNSLGVDYHGIDGSAELVQIANSSLPTKFKHVTYDDIVQGKWEPSQKFESLCFNFSLMDEDILDLLKRVRTFLVPQGKIFVQTLNPRTLVPYKDGWRMEDFKSMTISFDGQMPWYGRTLESWGTLFANAGLRLQKTSETNASVIFRLTI